MRKQLVDSVCSTRRLIAYNKQNRQENRKRRHSTPFEPTAGLARSLINLMEFYLAREGRVTYLSGLEPLSAPIHDLPASIAALYTLPWLAADV